jgi:hypothetical protein
MRVELVSLLAVILAIGGSLAGAAIAISCGVPTTWAVGIAVASGFATPALLAVAARIVEAIAGGARRRKVNPSDGNT